MKVVIHFVRYPPRNRREVSEKFSVTTVNNVAVKVPPCGEPQFAVQQTNADCILRPITLLSDQI